MQKKPLQLITIGNSSKDAELIAEILKYKKERNLKSAADAVRILCEDALNMKKAMR